MYQSGRLALGRFLENISFGHDRLIRLISISLGHSDETNIQHQLNELLFTAGCDPSNQQRSHPSNPTATISIHIIPSHPVIIVGSSLGIPKACARATREQWIRSSRQRCPRRSGMVKSLGLDSTNFCDAKTILKWKKWIRMDQNPMIFWVILSHVEPYSRTYVFLDQFSRPQKRARH